MAATVPFEHIVQTTGVSPLVQPATIAGHPYGKKRRWCRFRRKRKPSLQRHILQIAADNALLHPTQI